MLGWLSTVAAAQTPETATLSGSVVELGSGLPLPGAIIEITADGPPQRAVADEEGDFRIVVPAGRVQLVISAPEHRDGTFVESVATDEIVQVKYRLERFSWTEEVVVYGEARQEVARTVISMDELRRIPGSFGDPIRALQSLPSVTRGPDLSGDIVARGAEAVNTAAYVDGIRIPFLFHFLVGRSVVNPGLIEDIEFFPGAVPPRYGDVNQAVINARTRFDPADPGFHGRVHADLLELGWSGNANLGDGWTLRFGGRRAWVASVVNGGVSVYRAIRGLNDPAVRPATAKVPYRDQQVRIVKDFGRARLAFTLLSARDAIELVPEAIDLDNDGKWDEPPVPNLPYNPYLIFESRFERAQARWDREFADGGTMSTWGTVGRDSQQNLVPGLGLVGQSGLEFAALKQGWVSFGHDGTYPLRPQLDLHTGGEITIQPGQIVDLSEAPYPTTEALRLWAGPFGELVATPGQWRLAPGFRVSVHQLLDGPKVVPEPRFGVRYAFDDHWSIIGYVGVLSQGPTLPQAGVGLARGTLGVAKALQSTVGIEARWPSGWGFDLNAYETEMADLVLRDVELVVAPPPLAGTTLTTGDVDVAQILPVPYYETLRGRAYGIEAQLRLMPKGDTFGWVAGSVGRSFRYRDDGTSFRANSDVPFNLVAVWGTGLGKNWTVSGRAQLSSGLVFSPLLGHYEPGQDAWYGVEGERNADRYPLYRRVDLRVDKTWIGRRARWTLYLDVFNALNQHNPLFATYDIDYQNLDVQAFVPILPALGLEVAY